MMQGAPEREKKALEWKKKWGGQNPESLIELFSSFFALYAHVLQVWVANRDQRYHLYNPIIHPKRIKLCPEHRVPGSSAIV